MQVLLMLVVAFCAGGIVNLAHGSFDPAPCAATQTEHCGPDARTAPLAHLPLCVHSVVQREGYDVASFRRTVSAHVFYRFHLSKKCPTPISSDPFGRDDVRNSMRLRTMQV